jgi:hypothetical protein
MYIFIDGKLKEEFNEEVLWCGLFSRVGKNGNVIKYIESCLPENTICVIPKTDGNIRKSSHDLNWLKEIQPYIDLAKETNKIFILGTLAQIEKYENINYLYIPLDDDFFKNGTEFYFNNLKPWEERSNELCWRGGCSGYSSLVNNNLFESVRIRFTKKLYDEKNDIRLSYWWSEGKNIEEKYFADRIHYSKMLNYKIFFIVDGNVIASNHMWGFASGCVPFLISNATCWFSEFLVPWVNHIPVKYDLSDLVENIEWVRNNDEKAKEIAINALNFSKKYFSPEFQKEYIREKISSFANKLNKD